MYIKNTKDNDSHNKYIQWCVRTCLTTVFFWKKKVLIYRICQFCGINNPTMACFKLPLWCHWKQNWEEMCIISSYIHWYKLIPEAQWIYNSKSQCNKKKCKWIKFTYSKTWSIFRYFLPIIFLYYTENLKIKS